MYASDSVPNRSGFGLPKNAAQYAVLAKRVECHPEDFKARFGLQQTDISSTTKVDCSVINNVAWPSKKLARERCRKPLRQSEKSIRPLTSITDVVSPIGGLLCDPFVGTITLARAAGTLRRQSISIKVETTCFCNTLSRQASHLIAAEAESAS